MASKAFLIAVALIATIVAPTTAKFYNVGDSLAWSPGVNFQAWAAGKEFHVGDVLVFRYNPVRHNVALVNATNFQTCTAPLDAIRLRSGNDLLLLSTPGKMWYISEFGDDCRLFGMKLVINVLPEGSESPSSSPAPAPAPATETQERNGLTEIFWKILP